MIDTEINILKKQILEQLDFFLIVYKRDSDLDSTNFIYMCADILNDLEAYQDGMKLSFLELSKRAKSVLKQCNEHRDENVS